MKFKQGDKVRHVLSPHVVYTIKGNHYRYSEHYTIEELPNLILDANELLLVNPLPSSYSYISSSYEIKGDLVNTSSSCIHNLEKYFGLNERYNYCTKCSYTDRKY